MIPQVTEASIAAVGGDAETEDPEELMRKFRETMIVEQPWLYCFIRRQAEAVNGQPVQHDGGLEDAELEELGIPIDETQEADYEIVDAGALLEQGALLSYWLVRTAFEGQALEIEAEIAEVIRRSQARRARPWWRKLLGIGA
jgi:hypothetical protein